jgi:chromosome segregation ATPase
MRPAPRRSIRQRPPSVRRVVRSRSEAAAELIRLEHERDRLTQTLASLEPRRENARERLRQIDERERLLLGMLEIAAADDAAYGGTTIHPTRQGDYPKGLKT